MNAPDWWLRDGATARALSPLSAATAWYTARRVARPGWRAPVPVFCCGNATMGGAGKTTVALDFGHRLLAQGRRVHFLSRGYGGTATGPIRVDRGLHDARFVGDEPLLLAAVAPCWVGRDRAAAARAAIRGGAEVLVMDDGLQNSGIADRRNALVIDGGSGFGNGRLFPAGPLREPVAAAAERCGVAVLIGPDATGALAALPGSMPVLRGRLVTDAMRLSPAPLYAFAGIARPQKFFDGLEAAGAALAARIGFPDHHRFTGREIDRLLAAAERLGAVAATTPKDAVRLPADIRRRVRVIDVALEWERPAAVDAWLCGA